MATPRRPRTAWILLVPAVASLVLAVAAGLARMGWALPVPTVATHGAAMVWGVFGTLIGAERAVALGWRWPYLAPALCGLAGLCLVAGAQMAGTALATAGSAALVAVMVAIYRRMPALFTVTLAAGTAAGALGNAVWLATGSVPRAVPWWAAFLVLTVAAERLELSRVLALTRAQMAAFGAAVVLLGAGLALSVWVYAPGVRLAGAGFLALAACLMRHDIARRNLRQPGATGFMAACLLLGHIWLAVAGALALAVGGDPAGLRYDATWHAIFLGFVFSMVFGHALIILPAVTGVWVPFHPAFYVHLVLLHLAVAARVGAGVAGWAEGRRWAGLLAVLALAAFAANTAWAVRQGRRGALAHG